MKPFIIIHLVLIMAFQSIFATQTPRPSSLEQLMPVPQEVTAVADHHFRVNSGFRIAVVGDVHSRMFSQATRFLRRLDNQTGLFFEQGYLTSADAGMDSSLLIEVKKPGNVVLGMDESYSLEVGLEQIRITANCDIGALRGLETLLQLLDSDSDGYYFPGVKIVDQPRFPWRGLMIDSARHFIPIDGIIRNLDAMAAVKLNVMHWHLSEDQGFRVECKTFPKLHEMGSDGDFYTHEQIREVIAHADELGIRVVPEFDIPGHASSWLVGYPELASGSGPYEIVREWGIFHAVLNPSKESTYVFLDKFFDEMTALFPDKYMHIGGDEVEPTEWKENEHIQLFMQENNIEGYPALQSYFNQRLLEILTAKGKKMMGWDEILQPDMPKDVMIQSWRGKDSMEAAARSGYASILSNGYYIDLMHPASKHYLNDPIPQDTTLSEVEQSMILGGEATMWSEHVTVETLDSRIWPRTAAIAERFWSDASVNDVDDMYRRLSIMSLRLEEHGLAHLKNRSMMMRRLAGGYETRALEILADVIEPLKFYERPAFREYSQFSPYTLLADVATADAIDARIFNGLVLQYIDAPSDAVRESILEWLELWSMNDIAFKQLSIASPALREGDLLSERLSALAGICLKAMSCHNSENPSESSLQAKVEQCLELAREPVAATALQIVDACEQLLQFCLKN